MILAHQQTGQLPQELFREILGNVSTLVSFQVSQPDAVRLSKEFISQYDFEIETIPAEKLLQLNVGEAYCRIGKSAFPFYVPKVSDSPNRTRAEQVIQASREQYGISSTLRPEARPSGPEEPIDDPLADIDPEGVFD